MNTIKAKGQCMKLIIRMIRVYWIMILLTLSVLSSNAHAQETVCAEVKIEILQELTLEGQAFEAKLEIENTLADQTIEDINVVVEFLDQYGDLVIATSDSSDTSAQFFIRVDELDNINNVEGSGVLAPGETANATWLIIPAPGASDGISAGKLYFIGATFNYTLDGDAGAIEVAPDSIYIKPMPLLSLDYFIPRDVFADNPLTDEIEPIEPFTLGVRVQNKAVERLAKKRLGKCTRHVAVTCYSPGEKPWHRGGQ